MEIPFVPSGLDVVRTDPSGRHLLCQNHVGHRRTDDHGVTEHQRRRLRRQREQVLDGAPVPVRPGNTVHQIDSSAIPEVGYWPACRGIDRDQEPITRRPHDASVALVLPIRHTTMTPGDDRRCARFVCLGVIGPQRLAGPGVDGRSLVQRGAQIQDASDHQRRRDQKRRSRSGAVDIRIPTLRVLHGQRIEHLCRRSQPRASAFALRKMGVDRRPPPGDLELLEVLTRDLIQRGVLRAAYITTVAAPLAVRGALLGASRTSEQHHPQGDACR